MQNIGGLKHRGRRELRRKAQRACEHDERRDAADRIARSERDKRDEQDSAERRKVEIEPQTTSIDDRDTDDGGEDHNDEGEAPFRHDARLWYSDRCSERRKRRYPGHHRDEHVRISVGVESGEPKHTQPGGGGNQPCRKSNQRRQGRPRDNDERRDTKDRIGDREGINESSPSSSGATTGDR